MHTVTRPIPVLVGFDQPYRLQGTLIGADEVGRGSWVGPVIAAAVHLPEALLAEAPDWLAQLNDSKKLSQGLRETLALHIHTHALVGFGSVEVAEIEALNLHHASLLAARRAVACLLLSLTPDNPVVLMDGKYPLPQWTHPQWALIKGDGLSASIAAASIVAKVQRDKLLTDWHTRYPHYGWAQNKGYGTPAHQAAILQHGPNPLHRPRFLRKLSPTT